MMHSITRIGIISLLLLGGCLGGGAPTPTIVYPIIQIPQRPELHVITREQVSSLEPHILHKMLENDNRLKNHIEKLEAAINAYNNWAKNRWSPINRATTKLMTDLGLWTYLDSLDLWIVVITSWVCNVFVVRCLYLIKHTKTIIRWSTRRCSVRWRELRSGSKYNMIGALTRHNFKQIIKRNNSSSISYLINNRVH